jgi:hypothetical protein
MRGAFLFHEWTRNAASSLVDIFSVQAGTLGFQFFQLLLKVSPPLLIRFSVNFC